MPFRYKTIIGIAVIEAIMLALLVWNSLYILTISNEKELLKRAQTTTELFATSNKDAVLSTDIATLTSFVKEVLTHPGIIYARVIGRDRVVLAEGGNIQALSRAFKADYHYADVTDAVFDTFAVIQEGEIEYGRVEIGFSIEDIDAVIADAKRKSIGFASAEMVFTALFSLILGIYLTRAISQLQKGAQAVSSGRLGYQIEVKGRDELAAAALSFNEMSQRLRELDTAHEKQRRELQHAHKEWENIFQAIGHPTLILDPEHTIIAANEAASTAAGTPAEQLIGQKCYRIFHGTYETAHDCPADRTLASGSLEEGPVEMESLDKKFLVSCTPVYDEQGSIRKIIHIATDITEKIKADEALKNSELKFRSIFNSSNDGILIADTESKKFVMVNNSILSMLGYSEKELLDMSVLDIHPEEDIPTLINEFNKSAALKKQVVENVRVKRKDGSIFYADISAFPQVLDGKDTLVGVFRDISDRMAAMKALKEQRDRAQLYFNLAGVMLVIINMQKEIALINDKGTEILGYSAADLIGSDWFETCVPERMRHEVSHVFEKLITGMIEPVEYYENPVVTKSGDERMIAWHNTILTDNKGKIIGTLSSGEDITERKRAEQKLDRELEISRAMVDLSKTLMAQSSLEEISVQVLEHAKKLTGSNYGYVGYIDPQTGDLIVPTLTREIWDECNIEDKDVVFKKYHGLWGWVLENKKPILSNNPSGDHRSSGTPAGHIEIKSFLSAPARLRDTLVGQIALANSARPYTDDDLRLTERLANLYALAIEQNRSAHALMESEERFRTMFESATVGISASDPEGTLLRCNPAFQRMLGYSERELHVKFADITHPDDVEENLRLFKEMISGKRDHYWMEKRYIRKDGSLLHAHLSVTAIRDEQGDFKYNFAIIEDMSERKKLEEQLRHSQKMEAVGQLAGGIAHDFNNVLTAIIGYGNILKLKTRDNEKLQYNSEQILRMAERGAALTRGLLAFSRKQLIEPIPVNINTIIETTGKLIPKLTGEDIDLVIDLTENQLPVMADSVQIEQVLINLASNARDAMPEGGTLTIRTERVELSNEFITIHGYGKSGPHAAISVTDTGVGMDQGITKKIFEPFFTTKEVGRGTGLGLAMVYGIIKQHQGHINVTSQPGKGSTFEVYLPLLDKGIVHTTSDTDAFLSGGTETILLAEDEKEVRESLKQILEEYGFTVIDALDGNDAVEKFRANSERIQLLILDLVMPKKNGKETYMEIIKERPDIQAIFISGHTAKILETKGLNHNTFNFLSKPFATDDLLKMIREVLDR